MPSSTICLCRILIAAIVLACASGTRAEEPKKASDWTPLFNGKDLIGWRTYLEKPGHDSDPNRVFSVHDGMLHIYKDSPAGSAVDFGWVSTKKDYSHYRLRFQYKWGIKKFAPRNDAVRDSGLLYHVVSPEPISTVWPRSVECQVQENDVGDIFSVGTIVDTTADPKSEPRKPQFLPAEQGGKPATAGDGKDNGRVVRSQPNEVEGWNTVEVIVRGDRAVHIVNGKINNRCTNMRRLDPDHPGQTIPLTKGQILFQAEGAEVLYRNIEIKVLDPAAPDDETAASAGGGGTLDNAPKKIFRAGAYAININPPKLPVVVNGGFFEAKGEKVHDPLHARCLVLDDGQTKIALAIVDNVAIPADLTEHAKQLATKTTGIPVSRMLISATHTHSAPSVVAALGSNPDPEYPEFLTRQIARGIQLAAKNLAPARVGWGVIDDFEHTHSRRWIKRLDKIEKDPFGEVSVRANMHPGYQNPEFVGPSGPVDPGISMLSIQSPDGRPIALLGNYSMHYVGAAPLSADYYGYFAEEIKKLIGAQNVEPPFVGIMSQGTSGDLMWMDYGKPVRVLGFQEFGAQVARKVLGTYRKIEHHSWVPLAMVEQDLTVGYRTPDEKRLAWAQGILAGMKGRPPRTFSEVYAREADGARNDTSRKLKLQAIRIGDLGIVAVPNEVFAVTGLQIKAYSPLPTTFTMSLANGAAGYIPTPAQHKFGGYTTWPTRMGGLEAQAEPKILEAAIGLLEQVSGKPRRKPQVAHGPYAQKILASNALAYWRMEEFAGLKALDATGQGHEATYEDLIAPYLDGPPGESFRGPGQINRAAHFAGGRLHARLPMAGSYSVELWFWNGLDKPTPKLAGVLLSNGNNTLGIGGQEHSEKLVFSSGKDVVPGKTRIPVKSWHHVVLARDNERVRVYLDGKPEIDHRLDRAPGGKEFWLGGGSDSQSPFQGKLDEVSVYNRALSAAEVAGHYQAAVGAIVQKPKTASAPVKGVGLQPDPPRSPQESLEVMHVRDGFQVELVVAEPLVVDPVAIEWGPDGKLWVAEMADYPLGMDGKMKSGGRIRYLEDTDGDGRYDKSTLFLEGVNFPNGVMPWRDGVLVTAAPEIFFARDTDGDGKADVRQTLYKGFVEGNPQLRVNGLEWGLDGWVYCANGWSGGSVHSEKTGGKMDIGGRDLRIKPDEGLMDTVSGVTEFGRNRDDWGNWFGCDNSNPLWHFVLEDHYTRRNPFVAPPDSRNQLLVPPNPQIFARSKPQKRYHTFDQAGRFTSACSTMFYRDELLFGRDGAKHAFVCEPVHNLVHHAIVSDAGASFSARRPDEEQQSEFLASEDLWFRPVMVRTGPDGALWVVDMYRYMIEHPEWLPPEGKEEMRPFFRLGDDRGRIYRIYPTGKRPRSIPRLDRLDAKQLAAAIESPSGWQRDTAQQLLAWRQGRSASESLEKLFTASSNPLVRLQTLCTMDTLGLLTPVVAMQGLADADGGVRRQAIRLTETLGKTNSEVRTAVLKLVEDPDAKVRLQLACSLGAWDDQPASGHALGKLAVASEANQYLKAAVLSSLTKRNIDEVVETVLAASRTKVPNTQLIGQLWNLAASFGRDDVVTSMVFDVLKSTDGAYAAWQLTALAGTLDALERRAVPFAQIAASYQERGKMALERVVAVEHFARQIAFDDDANEANRAAAVELLLRDPATLQQDLEALGELLVPQTPLTLQSAVVRRLARQKGPLVAGILLGSWQSHGPKLRSQILSTLLSRPPWLATLLDQIAAGKVLPADIDPTVRQQLVERSDPQIRQRAQKLLSAASDADRQKVVAQHQAVLKLTGNYARGEKQFQKKCALCHRLGDVGHEVGPNLASLSDKSASSLLVAILDPSRNVETRYKSYVALTTDGRTFSGVLASETGNSIVLLGQEGKQEVILRTELAGLRSSGKSLMPDGLEKEFSQQDFADLIAYLSTAGANSARLSPSARK